MALVGVTQLAQPVVGILLGRTRCLNGGLEILVNFFNCGVYIFFYSLRCFDFFVVFGAFILFRKMYGVRKIPNKPGQIRPSN